MSYCCDNALLVRKQRDEIILLTKELKEQENQLSLTHIQNLKLKEKVDKFESQKVTLDNIISSLKLDAKNLENQAKTKSQEIDNLKQKIKEKDSYIQNQGLKLIKLQASCDKSNHELDLLDKNHNEMKSQNMKLNIKTKEQSKRILELKEAILKKDKIIETKNNLIQTSAEHIEILEKNLKRLIDFTDAIKERNEKTKQRENDLNIDKLNDERIRNSSSNDIWTIVEKSSEPNLLNTPNEVNLNTIIRSLKETWFESNLKYEEVKNMLMKRIEESNSNTTLLADEKTSITSISNRIATSSPINA